MNEDPLLSSSLKGRRSALPSVIALSALCSIPTPLQAARYNPPLANSPLAGPRSLPPDTCLAALPGALSGLVPERRFF